MVMRFSHIAAFVFILGCVCSAIDSEPKKPNVIVFLGDDIGYGDLSSHGHPTIYTPNLDRFNADGVRFTQWYSNFHVCTPSRAALMTGRMPVRYGMASWHWGPAMDDTLDADALGGLPKDEITMAAALKPAGYISKMIGKWHLGQREEFLPTNHGFDEYYGIPFSADMGGSSYDNYTTNPNRTPLPLLDGTTIIEQPVDLSTLTQRYTDTAIEFVSRNHTQPFFLYLAYQHAHVPNFASKETCNTTLRGPYGDAMVELDNSFGRVRAAVTALGLDEDTIMFFSTDNGPEYKFTYDAGSGGILYEGKHTTWEGGVRVPGAVVWKDHIVPRMSQEVVMMADIFPTVMSLAGVPLPADRIIDGRDLSPLLFNASQPSPHECVFHYRGATSTEFKDGLWAMRCGAYKAHFMTTTNKNLSHIIRHDPPLMYQVQFDPSEKYPLDSKSGNYQEQLAIILAAREAHFDTVVLKQSQIGLGADSSFAVCCDWNSQERFPNFPTCTCNPENWNAWTCENLPPTYPDYSEVDDDAMVLMNAGQQLRREG